MLQEPSLFTLALVACVLALIACLLALISLLTTRSTKKLMLLLPDQLTTSLAVDSHEKHRILLKDLHKGLADNTDRLSKSHHENTDRLRSVVNDELSKAREQITLLQADQTQRLAESEKTLARQMAELILQLSDRMRHQESSQDQRLNAGQLVITEQLSTLTDTMSSKMNALIADQSHRLNAYQEIAAQQLSRLILQVSEKQDLLKSEMLTQTLTRIEQSAKTQQSVLLETLADVRVQFTNNANQLSQNVDARLLEISGKVNERLDDGFKKTNETFISVITRLATIDAAQQKIESLAGNVVSLQQLLGDKRARGAFGEVQLEHVVKNMLPDIAYAFQHTFSNGARADCILKLPDPTGLIAVDSKFPLENYEKLISGEATAAPFKADIKRHIDTIANKYILPGETSDGAVMFVPAEAVFAEIHAHHRDLVEMAASRHVWIVSPTTLMAVLNTARSVLRDVETRQQVHIIQEELGRLSKDFGRFRERINKLATHIKQAKEDVDEVQISSKKITEHFIKIERAELREPTKMSEVSAELIVPFSTPSPDVAAEESTPRLF